MKYSAPFNRCAECDEVITNPICPECLAKRMRETVQEDDPQLAELISGARIEGDTICLFCHQKMGLCAHCFSQGIYELLQEKNAGLAEDFLSRFDFELRKRLVMV